MLEFHADDYGLFPEQSRRILFCRQNGVLNGTSIMPNSPCLQECLEMLSPYINDMRLAIHLNLMEGKALSAPGRIPLLVNRNGIFSVSFFRLLLAQYGKKRREYQRQIREELSLQIAAVRPFFVQQNKALRLDGHAHWHMLPVVFDALMTVIEEDQLPVQYIRIPYEPVNLYLRHLFRIFPFHPVNVIKTIVLRVLARRNCRKYRNELAGMEQAVFFGVLFSGNFNYDKFSLLLPEAEKIAQKGQNVEFLAHPGAIFEEQDITALTNKDDVAFLSDPHRRNEVEALVKLKENRPFY